MAVRFFVDVAAISCNYFISSREGTFRERTNSRTGRLRGEFVEFHRATVNPLCHRDSRNARVNFGRHRRQL